MSDFDAWLRSVVLRMTPHLIMPGYQVRLEPVPHGMLLTAEQAHQLGRRLIALAALHPDLGNEIVLCCPVCGRLAEGDAWPTHPEFGYRMCPVCLREDRATVRPREATPAEAASLTGW